MRGLGPVITASILAGPVGEAANVFAETIKTFIIHLSLRSEGFRCGEYSSPDSFIQKILFLRNHTGEYRIGEKCGVGRAVQNEVV